MGETKAPLPPRRQVPGLEEGGLGRMMCDMWWDGGPHELNEDSEHFDLWVGSLRRSVVSGPFKTKFGDNFRVR